MFGVIAGAVWPPGLLLAINGAGGYEQRTGVPMRYVLELRLLHASMNVGAPSNTHGMCTAPRSITTTFQWLG